MSSHSVRCLAVLGVLAVTAVLSACGDSPPPASVAADTPASTAPETTTTAPLSTTTSTSTTVLAGSTSPTFEPAGATVDADISVDADTVWEEVFSGFTPSEQSCIREAVDEELLESVLDRRVLESSEVLEQWEVSIFSCLAPQTARALFLSFMIGRMEADEELDTELTAEEMSCLREWVAGVDVAAAVAEFADEDSAVAAELVSGMFSCLTDLFLSMMVSEMAMDGVELNEEEMSCLREWVAGIDMGTLVAGFNDEDPSVLGDFVHALFGCVPDVFLSAMLEEVGVSFGDLTEDEASCLREWVTGADFGALFTDDLDAALAFVPDLLECIPDLYGSAPPEAPDEAVAYLTIVFEDATTVTIDEQAQGELDEPYETDYFVFDALEGKLYQIDVALGTLEDSVATLYDSEAAPVEYNDDHGGTSASRILWVAPSSGSYYVEVASWGDGTGSYTLTVAASDIIDDHADTITEATSVITGGAVLGVVDYPGDTDLFVFDALEGKLYQIDVALGTLEDSVATLYDSEAAPVEYNDDHGGTSASRILWVAPSSGSYYVEVASWGDGTGSYTLTVAASDIIDDHADTITEATSVITGGAVLGVVDYPGDTDLFVFDALEGKLYQIDVALGTLEDSVATLYDSEAAPVEYNDDHGGTSASRILWVAPSSGSYYVEVASWGDGTGSYTLTVAASDIIDDHADTITEATSVITGGAVLGVVDYPGDTDLFVFDALEGKLYQIDVALGTLEDSVATLYDSEAAPVEYNDDHGGTSASRILWVAPSSGSYYVEVASWGDGTGSYTLTVAASDIIDDHADTITEATSVITGGAVLGVVDYPGDTDLFVFDALEGKLYQIDVALGTLEDSVATLYDSEAAPVEYNDDHGGTSASRILWVAPSSGSYYVEVASWGDGTGSYTLTVAASDIIDDHADTITEATSVITGGAVLGVVDYPGDTDLFVFDAVHRELYQIDVALGTLEDSVVAVYDADEWQLAFNDDYEDSSASRVFWEAPSSGRYYVEVASPSAGTGSYTLTIIIR